MRAKLLWLVFILLSFVITLPVSWWGLTKVDFFYPVLHDSIGIDSHIKRYAPRNIQNKKGFEQTTKDQRVSLFHEVVIAIHNNGDGLDKLIFTTNDTGQGRQKILLFTEAEVTHLKDVANLLDKIKPTILISLLIWLLSMTWMFWKRIRLPSSKQLTLLSLAWVIIAVLILSVGPEKVFNQLHIWAFPPENQWFFYYEESLMSTMMKAPLLFAVIAAMWCLISVILTIVLLRLVHPVLLYRRNRLYE